MCGISGFWQTHAGDARDLSTRVSRMAGTLSHRGPDEQGEWVDAPAGVALGFRRLAILDLSPTGHQPMLSHDGRYTIAFNGEIYNYLDLRRELEAAGSRFRGTSDTEVLLEAVRLWNVDGACARAWGMFAMAVWDRLDRQLWLVRDRLGKKPLYYGLSRGVLLFGSELKSLAAHPAFERRIDRAALAGYLRRAYVPGTRSIYEGIQKVPPGAWVRFDAPDAAPREARYWDALDAVSAGVRARGELTDTPAGRDRLADELDVLLRDAVRRRMIADVPLGAFLSGGIDSSTVVALMQAQSTRPVKTFTIGFDASGYDEAVMARAVAKHLGTDHTELYLTPDDVAAVIPKLPRMYDEPFADSSQMPTYLVSALARRHVTVALSGDGGDEVFGGYLRYTWARAIWRRLGAVPRPARRMLGSAVAALPPERWDALMTHVMPVLPARWRQVRAGEKLAKLARIVDARDPDDLYERLSSTRLQPRQLMADGPVDAPAMSDASVGRAIPDFADRMMYLDLVTYLPGDILVKVDRASMSVSLEVRAPLLDHRLIEWAWRLPQACKLDGAAGKVVLRHLLARYLPTELIERPKMGFSVPIDVWLRGPLRAWAEELLDADRLRRDGYLAAGPVRQLWTEHLSGRANRQHELWTVLMFQAWLHADAIAA